MSDWFGQSKLWEPQGAGDGWREELQTGAPARAASVERAYRACAQHATYQPFDHVGQPATADPDLLEGNTSVGAWAVSRVLGEPEEVQTGVSLQAHEDEARYVLYGYAKESLLDVNQQSTASLQSPGTYDLSPESRSPQEWVSQMQQLRRNWPAVLAELIGNYEDYSALTWVGPAVEDPNDPNFGWQRYAMQYGPWNAASSDTVFQDTDVASRRAPRAGEVESNADLGPVDARDTLAIMEGDSFVWLGGGCILPAREEEP